MATGFAKTRLCVLAALFAVAFAFVLGARADDEQPAQQQPAAAAAAEKAPSGQKGGGGRATTPTTPSAAELHRLPPDSSTRQTLELPGRKLSFTAIAGSIRLFDGKGRPHADIAH